jgi:DNA replication and repair protein RecF
MHLDELYLLNFKNYPEANLRFSPAVNVLVGKNGSGKTNLLDAIYSLSFTKSAFAASDAHCISTGQQFFMVKGKFHREGRTYELLSSVQTGTKKVFKEEGSDYPRLSDHIGKYPVVLMAPDDVDLIRESSESRRKFFDSIISQVDKAYLLALMQYNQALKQRNSLLKMFQERGAPDWIMLESYDEILQQTGQYIFTKRAAFAGQFLPVFQKYFRFIVADGEVTDLAYSSELKNKDFGEGLRATRAKDLVLQRTSFGIHRDDYEFTLGEGDLRRLGSQGQQKSFVIALKLAQFELLEKEKGFKPILLLDDIFDKLDDHRIARLLELMKGQLGQLFISDARPDRTISLLESMDVEATRFIIENGVVLK